VAAEVLESMPQSRQDELLYRIANLSEVNSDVVRELEQLIDRSISVLTNQGSQVRGVKQAADIMNRFKGNRDQMFELLRAHDETLVEQIEDQMCDFCSRSRETEAVMQVLPGAIPRV